MASDEYNWAQGMKAPEMSFQELSLRNVFVAEYLVDYDQVAAAIRCGFMSSIAEDYARKFMSEPYVQQELKKAQLHEPETDADKDNEDTINKRRIMMGLMREAHNKFNSGAARVAALGRLALIYGMDAPSKSQHEIMHRGGVMMVPAIADITEWEQAAISSQTKLVTETRADL